MFQRIRAKLRWATLKSWLGLAGMWGAALLLPCPDCGGPMLLHLWPVALALTLAHLHRERHPALEASPDEPTSDSHDSSRNG